MRTRRGFTLVEVSLFLAITGILFVGIAIGTQNSIFQQRYMDAVQSFAEFLRTTYSQVTNVQSFGDGTTDRAIYGRLVVFSVDGDKNKIESYAVFGDVEGEVAGTLLQQLGGRNLSRCTSLEGECMEMKEEFTPRWGSQIQTAEGWSEGYEFYKGALLIIRHPITGTVYTYASNSSLGGIDEYLSSISGFESKQVDFCVNPNGAGRSDLRKDIRIIKNARNASGIETVSGNGDCK